MPGLIFLGTASAVAYPGHENSHLLFEGESQTILVDCVGNPVLRLGQVGREINEITDLIITHFHPDHVTGIPLLLMNMWLLGRTERLDIYGLGSALKRVEKMMGLFGWSAWDMEYAVEFHHLPEENLTLVLETPEFRIQSSPVNHLIPTIGLRIEFLEQNRLVAYSGDTEPCPQVVDLAAGADLLIHEAAGNYSGHTSPGQAGEIADQAGVKELFLIYYSFHEKDAAAHLAEAQKTFSGRVALAEDLTEINFE